MDSEANNCNGTTANSGLAQSNVYKNDSHCMQRTVLDMNVDTDVSHYICRILANLINSGRSYLIVYQSYFSQVLNGLLYKTPAVLLCKSIVISIQWFQIPHTITFSTI